MSKGTFETMGMDGENEPKWNGKPVDSDDGLIRQLKNDARSGRPSFTFGYRGINPDLESKLQSFVVNPHVYVYFTYDDGKISVLPMKAGFDDQGRHLLTCDSEYQNTPEWRKKEMELLRSFAKDQKDE